ncbi:hypothetical protein BDP27DRAFT_1223038 [Rhodocollybia butyracea]|uniref:Uncharacterized protein n=1 Tax=Rhodocollybia butyracea TaxID=206335 RepID=A0A9P5U7T8_9AGAR|nr:hypothetical protein BDP27DRAFT_1223038 [Rhodocollybia butyracea]
MKAREYCCCAIPLVNSGIYFALTEQLVAGFLIAILSFATPNIVGAATPSFAKWLLGIVCLVASAVQIFGFLGVAREKPILFRRYITLHSLAIVAAFAIAAAWVITSATKHSTAQSNCIAQFFNTTDSTEQSEGNTLCNIFPWVDVGIMAGIWVWLAIMHVYLYVVINSYSSAQQRDHIKYNALNNSNGEGIPLDNRASGDYAGGHARQFSAASMSDVMNQPVREPRDGFSYSDNAPYVPQSNVPYGDSVSHPNYAYTQNPGPTPGYNNGYYDDSADLSRPPQSQAHPGEFR